MVLLELPESLSHEIPPERMIGMKKLSEIIWNSIGFLLGGFWALIPLYLFASYLFKQFGLSASLSEKLAVLVITAITVGFGGVAHEEDACKAIQSEQKGETVRLQNEIAVLNKNIRQICAERDSLASKLEESKRVFREFAEDTVQSSPWLARKFTDAVALVDGEVVSHLRAKKNPALKAAEQIREMSREKREILRRSKELEYQLQFYEGLFPWLEEFKTVPADKAAEYVHSTEDGEYDRVRNWLSPEEYFNLSTIQRNQLALDRYMSRKKTDWDVGIEYERYIGYLYEISGFRVTYNGATQGLTDMGRDIIASDGMKTLVIQCKRWAKEKEIHEKHIFQLYGSTVLMNLETGGKCSGVFVTTAHLSVLSRKCAKYLGIEFVEEKAYDNYPLIKCNVSKSGEKIYHLPFDQQYDRVQICGKDGAMFVRTVQEAENNGFRRAKRWVPELDF